MVSLAKLEEGNVVPGPAVCGSGPEVNPEKWPQDSSKSYLTRKYGNLGAVGNCPSTPG